LGEVEKLCRLPVGRVVRAANRLEPGSCAQRAPFVGTGGCAQAILTGRGGLGGACAGPAHFYRKGVVSQLLDRRSLRLHDQVMADRPAEQIGRAVRGSQTAQQLPENH
jgi:hypothetical protein